jgi:hypothetical protein
MPSVGLVASQNGLGHARRLTHFSGAFEELGYQVSLYLSSPQVLTLSKEIREVCPKTKVFEIPCYGLDGPAQINSTVRVVPKSLQRQFREFDFVLSDNLTWPGSFLENFLLMGHFTWIDYWAFRYPNQELEIDKALLHASKISNWFAPVDFSQIPTQLDEIGRTEIPLSRYISDPKAPHNSDLTGVFFSNGTTGLNQSDQNELGLQLKKINLVLTNGESHSFRENQTPALTLGRPGLGTIRDCLAFGIPFLPCWVGDDPELFNNEATLKRIGLIPSAWKGNEKPNIEIIREFLKDTQIQDRIRAYWMQNSVPVKEILPIMGF